MGRWHGSCSMTISVEVGHDGNVPVGCRIRRCAHGTGGIHIRALVTVAPAAHLPRADLGFPTAAVSSHNP
jgi:hypothetical protein